MRMNHLLQSRLIDPSCELASVSAHRARLRRYLKHH